MKITVEKNKKKEEKGWDEVKLVEWTDGKGVNNMIVLTNGKHEGDENGVFEGTILYNNIVEYFDGVGTLGVNWYKENFKEVSYLELGLRIR